MRTQTGGELMADDAPVAVVEGPKGKAEIYEVFGDGRNLEYKVKHNYKR
jgi:hypothetical protein